MAFDFKRHLIKVQGGRQYLPVSARLIWFRSDHPDWGVETEAIEINHEKQYAVFRARIYNEDGKLMAMGTKKEDVKGFGDYIEKAETGAVGRALALCGYGTQFSPELDETGPGRFADSPQPMGGRFGSNGDGGGGNYNSGGGNRYGNDGGARFTPPRESPPPARESAPTPRDTGPAREAAPRDEPNARLASLPNEAPARPTVVREDAPVRPAAPDPARRPPPTADDDDDFETLVGSANEAEEDDPFGEEPAQQASSAPRGTAAAKPAAANATPACINCNKALTKAQQDLSIRNYGEALCPGCQKDRGRTERPAAAAR